MDNSFFNALFNALFTFFSPMVAVIAGASTIVSFLVGALLNPQGALNKIVCGAIDIISSIFPSTPDNLKISSLITSAASAMPAVGRGVIEQIVQTVFTIVALMLVIKIYKLIPFKAT